LPRQPQLYRTLVLARREPPHQDGAVIGDEPANRLKDSTVAVIKDRLRFSLGEVDQEVLLSNHSGHLVGTEWFQLVALAPTGEPGCTRS
jgi:hypothetical protein